MHRPTLILRRFGTMSFGLGYFEGSTWVDHTTLLGRGRELRIAGAATAAERRAVHTMLECCDAPAVYAERLDAVALTDDRGPAVMGYRSGDADVDAVAGRTSAR